MQDALSRRRFLLGSVTGISATLAAAHWPAALAAADHARAAVRAGGRPNFEFFTVEQAAEIDAIAARIIPTDDTPGAREAGVVYFIDRALKTFASDSQKSYIEGLPDLQAKVREMFPGVEKFSAAAPEQQDEVLRSFDENSNAKNFFETLRHHTIAGFLIDRDSHNCGNRDGVGWTVIGRDRKHMFQPPFGYYDKDYPGWQAAPKDAEKK